MSLQQSVVDQLARYNTLLDLISQIEYLTKATNSEAFALLAKIHEVRALTFYEMKQIENFWENLN